MYAFYHMCQVVILQHFYNSVYLGCPRFGDIELLYNLPFDFFFLNIDTPKPSVLHIKFKTSFIS